MECIVCGTPISKKARTCSAKCRQRARRLGRSKIIRGVTNVTVSKCDKPSMTDLEKCRYCSKPLPPLLKPRRYLGACYECALKSPRKASIDALGDIVYAGAERPL
jgi:hypothetical protein